MQYSIEEVFNYLNNTKIFSASKAHASKNTFHGLKVYAEFSAYQLWMKYKDNFRCVNCQRKAYCFLLKKHQQIKDVYFFQLYCIDQNKSLILMTKKEQAKLINNTTDLIIIYEAESYLEQEILAQKYLNLNNKLQKISDKKSKEIFGEDNMTRNDKYMLKYYFHLQKIKKYYMQDMINNNLNLIHLSKSATPIIMHPRVPNNKLTKKGVENNTIPRICFSNSIFGALAAIEPRQGDEMYVHIPINPQKIILNKDVIKYVPDAINTGETWILDNYLYTNIVGKVIVGNSYGIIDKYYINKDIQYTYYYDYIFYPNESKLDNRIMNIIHSI